MCKPLLIAALAGLLVLPTAGMAETFDSNALGFTAEFPKTPTQEQPVGTEKDSSGNFIANVVRVYAVEQDAWFATVGVGTYLIPIKLDATQMFPGMRDTLVKTIGASVGVNASVGASSVGTQDGNSALFFDFDTPDHSIAGRGLIAYLATEKPRDYIVYVMHSPNLSSDRTADLDRFLKSFHIH